MNPPAAATAPISGIAEECRQDEEQHRADERGHERGQDRAPDPARLAPPDHAAQERPHERQPEEQERDHQHPDGGTDDAAAP
jgi:hypothetical protein